MSKIVDQLKKGDKLAVAKPGSSPELMERGEFVCSHDYGPFDAITLCDGQTINHYPVLPDGSIHITGSPPLRLYREEDDGRLVPITLID